MIKKTKVQTLISLRQKLKSFFKKVFFIIIIIDKVRLIMIISYRFLFIKQFKARGEIRAAFLIVN